MGFMGHLPKLWDEMGQFLKIWDLWDGWEDCIVCLAQTAERQIIML